MTGSLVPIDRLRGGFEGLDVADNVAAILLIVPEILVLIIVLDTVADIASVEPNFVLLALLLYPLVVVGDFFVRVALVPALFPEFGLIEALDIDPRGFRHVVDGLGR